MVSRTDDAIANDGGVAPGVQVYTLGSFRVLVRGHLVEDNVWRRRTARQLLKALLSRPGRRMTRDEVIELLWPESDSDAAGTNLRSTLHAMRRALEPEDAPTERLGVVFADRESVWLRPDVELWVDADMFEQIVEQGHRATDPLPHLQRASAMYQGDYLPDDVYEDWSMQRREALKRTWIDVQFELANQHIAQGEPEAAIIELQRLLAADHTEERAAQELMRLLLQLRRRAEALRVFQTLEQALREDIGVEPSEASRDLQRLAAAATTPAGGGAVFQCAYTFPDPKQLVGRDAELNRLLATVHRGRTAGQGLLLSAPAGTGKSALAGALVKAARRSGVLCLAGAAYDERSAIPLAAFQEAFTDFVLAASSNPLDSSVAAAAKELIEAVRGLVHRPAAPGAAPGAAPAERTRFFAAMLGLLRRLAERGPVLICLEDLHAADEATLQLLHYLLRQTRQTPVVFVGTFRDEALVAGEPLAKLVAALTREELAERFELAPLDRHSTDQLITVLLGAPVAADLSDSVYRATDGNPLYVEQVVLTLRDQGRLQTALDDMHAAIADASGASTVVRELIEGRLSRLSARARETLEIAAVLGHAFDYTDLLAAVDPTDEAALLMDLDEAIRAQLIRERPNGYAFSHSLLREGMYWSLSRPRRMLLHTRVGDVLERRAGPAARNMAAELAYHFVSGGQSAATRGRALQYSIYAGEHATSLASNREAVHHFEVACDLIKNNSLEVEDVTRASVFAGLGGAQIASGQYYPAISAFRKVLDLATDACARARAHHGISFALNHLANTAEAQFEAEAGLAEIGGLHGPEAAIERLTLQSQLAWLWFLRGRFADVLRLGLSMAQVAEELNESQWLAWAQTYIGAAHTGSGRTRQALDHYELMLTRGEQGASSTDRARNRTNLGLEYYRAGQFTTARAHLERAVALYREAFSEPRAVLALQGLGWVHLAQADLRRAQEYAELSAGIAREAKDRWLAECLQLSGELLRLKAQWPAATAALEEALAIHRLVGHAAATVETLIQLGTVADNRGDDAAARDAFLQATRAADQMDPAPCVAAAHRAFGLLILRAGEVESAAEHIAHAVSLVREMAGTLEYAQTLRAQAALELRTGEPDEALSTLGLAYAAPRTALVQAQLHLTHANVLLDLHRPHDAATQVDAARKLAEQLASPGLLALAESASGAVASALLQQAAPATIRR
jgi:DNA-binding SARP family transcriptional activator